MEKVVYDIGIIGGGPGGYLAAERAGHAGRKTVLFEKRSLGGVCLNEGCIPSKAYLHTAKALDYSAHAAAYGVTGIKGGKIDQSAAKQRKDGIVKILVSGVASKLKANKVTVVKETAVITGKTQEGFCVAAGKEEYTCKTLLLAAGSEAVVPPIPGVKEGLADGSVLTNREILDLTEIPKSLAVIGGGVIGLEMASYFCSAGSKVTVIEMLNKIAGPTDAEISDLLKAEYEQKGVTFLLGCRVTGVESGSVKYASADGKEGSVPFDKCLLSIGRRPSTAGLGLESIGVYTERGAVVTDENMRTNIPGVYAAGDINGKMMLAHTAYREAEVAINHICGARDIMRYNAIASVIYTNPEVGSVGETEESAKAKGYNIKTAKVSMNYSGRYIAESEQPGRGSGICKIVVDAATERILGVHLLGSYASEIIYGAALMIEAQLTVSDIKELVFPHPTVCEVIREAIFAL